VGLPWGLIEATSFARVKPISSAGAVTSLGGSGVSAAFAALVPPCDANRTTANTAKTDTPTTNRRRPRPAIATPPSMSMRLLRPSIL
jgi:hypothetical protein